MHDLNTINRLNAEASAAASINAALAGGSFALAKFEGLHLVDHVATGDKESIEQAAADLTQRALPSTTYRVMAPAH